MRILIATYLVPTSPSGVITYCQTLVDHLTRIGVGVRLVDSSQMPVGWRKCIRALRRVMMPLGGVFSAVYEEVAYFIALYTAAGTLRSADFDLIHAQDARTGVAVWLALGRRLPIVLTCHFNDDPVQEIAGRFGLKAVSVRLLTSWYRYLFSFIRYYVFVSDYTYNRSNHLLPADLIRRTLRNTVRLPRTSREPVVGESKSPRLIISNVGFMDERKNQGLLLQIGHRLRSLGFQHFHLWFIGDGPKRVEYSQLAKELGLSGHVTFFGQQMAPWRLIAQSDLYVHTSLNDNCPYTIVEALAVGTPVLALPVGGIPEMLPAGFGALSGTTVDELTHELACFFDHERREQLRQKQAEFARQHFDHATNLKNLVSFYLQAKGETAFVVAQPSVAV